MGWGVADQAVSSLTNLALGIFVARSLALEDFGAFGLAWVTYGVALNVSRGLATDPLTVRYSGSADDEWRTAARRSASTATAIGLVLGALCLVVGLAIGGIVGSAFAALGLTLPGLLLQDAWRIAFFVAGKGRRAFTNDLVWALGLVPAMLVASRWPGTFSFMLAWGLAALAAALFGCFQTRMVPRPAGIPAWVREHRDLGPRYVAENVSDSGAGQLQLYGLGLVAGLAPVGAVRGAQILLAPAAALRMGISLIAVPEAARVLRRWPGRLPMFCLVLGGSQAAVCLLWGVALLLIPDQYGELALASIWAPASVLIIPLMIDYAIGAVVDGAFVGLRALGASRRSMPIRITRAVIWVVASVIGAFLAGAIGSVWGVVVANSVTMVLAWWQLGVLSRANLARQAAPSTAADPAA
jgi:hypothetical protein